MARSAIGADRVPAALLIHAPGHRDAQRITRAKAKIIQQRGHGSHLILPVAIAIGGDLVVVPPSARP